MSTTQHTPGSRQAGKEAPGKSEERNRSDKDKPHGAAKQTDKRDQDKNQSGRSGKSGTEKQR